MKSKQTIRELALNRKKEGYSTASTADVLKISQRTVQRWQKEGEKQKGSVARPERRKLTFAQEAAICEFVANRAGCILEDIVEFVATSYDVSISDRTASRILDRHDYTRKRGTRQNNKLSVIKSMQFLVDLRQLYNSNSSSLASIDEMSVMLNIAPTYGYAPRGQRAVIPQPSKRTVSRMLTLCVSPNGVLLWDLRDGSINGEVFSEILSRLPDGLILMLDNAPVHHASKSLSKKGLPTIAEVAKSKGIMLKYLPSYAPHLNPVEYTFNLVRNLLRRKQAWTEKRLLDALHEMFGRQSFSKDSLSKLFKSVAYGGPGPGERNLDL